MLRNSFAPGWIRASLLVRPALAHAAQADRTPSEVAKAFLRDMHAFHAEKDAIKRDEIAARRIHVLRKYQRSPELPIKPHQVKQIFEEMNDQA